MSNAAISAIGLCLDIVGVLLLWKFGLPPDVRRDGSSFLMLEQTDENEKKKGICYDLMSNTAIVLIILGFSMQLIGTLLPSNAFGRTQGTQTECQSSKLADSAHQSKQ
jgi:hypothetical protein